MSGARVVAKALAHGCQQNYSLMHYVMCNVAPDGSPQYVATRLITDMRLPPNLVATLTAFRPGAIQAIYTIKGIRPHTGRPKNSVAYLFEQDHAAHLVAGVYAAVLLKQLEDYPVDGQTLLTGKHILAAFDLVREHAASSVLMGSIDWERIVWATIALLKNQIVLDTCSNCHTPFLRTHTHPSWRGGVGCPFCTHLGKHLADSPAIETLELPLVEQGWAAASMASASAF